jgi:hypothetical protein
LDHQNPPSSLESGLYHKVSARFTEGQDFHGTSHGIFQKAGFRQKNAVSTMGSAPRICSPSNSAHALQPPLSEQAQPSPCYADRLLESRRICNSRLHSSKKLADRNAPPPRASIEKEIGTMALTDTFVKAVKHSGKPTGDKHTDGGAMFLLVNEGGKYWRMDYKFGGKRKTLALGVYPAVSLTDAQRFGQMMRDIETYTGSYITRAALKISALAFPRPNEVQNMVWNEIDLDAGTWIIPALRMKGTLSRKG